MADPRDIVKALIRLNRLENECRSASDRSKKKAELLVAIERERSVVPLPILAHHNRLRARGRDSTAPVRDWVCRACFLTVASGLRTHLVQRSDLNVCENCGSYSYIADGTEDYPDEFQLLEASRRQAARAEKKNKSSGAGKVRRGAAAGKALVRHPAKSRKSLARVSSVKKRK